ncbi:MAG: 5-formyltetrahydrofolate cyclo-ligase [Lachnospiraceae bacterium]|nr:5-formyltetrahydrofolate cyclo-ligase [Lachnospiraceae bacterium]MCI9546016.1 5-formyltetrahydrofolate cyclo-ligase [Lachnospiraceae bacterium]
MKDKQSIRKKIFAQRKEISEEQIGAWSQRIAAQTLQLEEFQKADCIYAYVDYNREVFTRTLIEAAWKAEKRVAVPKVHGKDLVFYAFTSYDQLEPGYFQIPEPAYGEAVNWEEALMLMPGVAFDAHRRRVGYGGGFYDRYLEKHPRHFTVALAFEFQVLDAVPYEQTDIVPDRVITQEKIYI